MTTPLPSGRIPRKVWNETNAAASAAKVYENGEAGRKHALLPVGKKPIGIA
jgi:hypothetical protein